MPSGAPSSRHRPPDQPLGGQGLQQHGRAAPLDGGDDSAVVQVDQVGHEAAVAAVDRLVNTEPPDGPEPVRHQGVLGDRPHRRPPAQPTICRVIGPPL
jgi:hypothetical protein